MHLPNYVDHNKIYEKIKKLNAFYKKYKILGSGSYRTTYDLGNGNVAKVPNLNSLGCGENTGISANITELAIYKRLKKTGVFAPCKLITKYGIPVLIMEKLGQAAPDNKYTEAIQKHKLCFDDGFYQCGRNKEGDIVCFDYGNEFDFLTPKGLERVEKAYTKIYKKYQKEPCLV